MNQQTTRKWNTSQWEKQPFNIPDSKPMTVPKNMYGINAPPSSGHVQQQQHINPEQQKLKSWLETAVKLPEYYKVFIDNGIDELSVAALITAESLDEMGIDKIGHQLILLNKVNQLKKHNAYQQWANQQWTNQQWANQQQLYGSTPNLSYQQFQPQPLNNTYQQYGMQNQNYYDSPYKR
eukprot:37381_1